MPREFASPELGNLIAARLAPEEIDRRLRAPLNEAEMNDVADLVRWFCRRYPTVKDRLDYARRKMQQYQSEARASSTGLPLSAEAYEESARRLAKAHRVTDPGIVHVLLDRDPNREEIRLVEVTRSAPTTMDPLPIRFFARPDLGFSFASAVLLLSPDEWAAVETGQLELPGGWSKSRFELL